MKLEEKTKKKDEQGLIIKKYQQYLKLEKSLSKNTLEAYLTDLEKLLSFLSAEGVEILEVRPCSSFFFVFSSNFISFFTFAP